LTGGLALGSLLAGLLIQFTTSANTIVFVGLIIATLIGLLAIAYFPESIARTEGVRHSLIPRLSVPAVARGEFVAAAPIIVAIWMLSAMSGGLAPDLVRSYFHVHSGLLTGVSGFVGPAASAGVGIVLTRYEPRRAMIAGIVMSAIGAGAIVGSLGVRYVSVMIIGQAIAGAGFGASFTAFLHLVVPLVAPHQHASLAAVTYSLSYTAFGIPIVAAGLLTNWLGMAPTVSSYAAATVLLAVVGLQLQLRRAHSQRSGTDRRP
jgi:hypothetical protein